MEIVNKEVVSNRVIVNVNNDVEIEALNKLLDLSGLDKYDDTILLNLFGINVKNRDGKTVMFKLNIGDMELMKSLGIKEFKVLRECGKLKTKNLLLWNDVEVFLLCFTVNEFKFIRGLLREIDYFDEVVFLDNRKKKDEIIYVDGSDLDNDYSVAC